MAAPAIGRTILRGFVCGLLIVSGCHSRRSADSTYQEIRQEVQRGQLDAALGHADAAYRRYDSIDIGTAWRFRVLKAHILFWRGSFAESLQLLDTDVPQSLEHSEVAARRAMVRGLDCTFLQRFDAAQKELKSAEEIAQLYQPSMLADVAQARGTLELTRQKYPEAASAFYSALSLARQGRLDSVEVSALGSLGNIAMWEEHYDEAIDWYKIALSKSEALGTHSSEALALGNMGWSYTAVGDFESAEAVLKQAEKASREAGREGNRVYWLITLGDVYFQQRRFVEAELTSNQALSLARSMDDKATVTTCLNILSEIALDTGRPDIAEKDNREALEIEKAGLDRSGIARSTIIAGRVAASKKQYAEAEGALQTVIRDQTVETPLRWQAQARLARVYADEQLSTSAEAQFLKAISTFETARAGVHRDEFRVSFLSTAIEFYDDYIGFLVAHGRPLDALRAADLARARTLQDGLAAAPKSISADSGGFRPEQLARRMKATFLFYWLGEKHSYLWVVTPLKTTCLPLPAASEIDLAVKSYREGVAASKDVAETEQPAGEKLYETLVAPAQKLIPQDSRVILLPDGSLYSLNFETLIVPSPKPHFWIEDVTLTTAGSLSLLAAGANRPVSKQKNLLLVGDALEAAKEFERLPQAEDEMQIVERYFPDPNRTVLKGGQATPTTYLSSNPERYAYLHFVTHGTASRTRPLESAVILSKDPASDSYKLYARDIVTRHLNAELVTISACNGSGTRSYSGEGLVGLSWAFVRAGAHNVIAALWEVSNAPSTSQLMDAFYKGISQGEDPATALRNAKLSFLRSPNPNYAFKKPYYWAPFQLYTGS